MSQQETANGEVNPLPSKSSTSEQLDPPTNKDEDIPPSNEEVGRASKKDQIDPSNSKEDPPAKKEEANPPLTNELPVNPAPNPQRKIRLNRRGFHLLNSPIMKLSEKPDKEMSSANGSVKKDDKIKTDSFQKKIISLSSVKNNSSSVPNPGKTNQSSTTIKLNTSSSNVGQKRNENSRNTEVSSSSDAPAQKKHKPITWP